MATVQVVVQPSGCINGRDWPAVGETIELPDVVAEGMARSGDVKIVKAPAKKAAAKPDTAEKRPAARKDVEKR